MRHNPLSGWTTVFGFTARCKMGTKGYIAGTLIVALILALCIPGGILLADTISVAGQAPRTTQITRFVLVDTVNADWQMLSSTEGIYASIPVSSAPDVETACSQIGPTEAAIIITEGEGGIHIHGVLSDDSALATSDVEGATGYFVENLREALIRATDLSPADLAQIFAPVQTQIAQEEQEAQPGGMVAELIEMLFPFALMMLMYFMILIYGNTCASTVIAEKTSKLMDTMLVSVRPGAMMVGKLLAVSLSGFVQFSLWVLSAIGGTWAGVALVRHLNPHTTIGIVAFTDFLVSAGVLFDPIGIVMAIAFSAAGLLLYCSLSAIGGALAGKPEDLSSTNIIFTFVLVISYLTVFYDGLTHGGTNLISDALWARIVPFTSILVQPGLLLMGRSSLLLGIGALAIVVFTAFLFALLAGRVYTLCAFRKGNPLKIFSILRLLRGKIVQ